MHNAALRAIGLDWAYVPFDVDPVRVVEAVAGVRALNLVGVNVTVPLKELIAPHLDVVDSEAALIGSVNTIHNVSGELRGYSTDGPGFLRALARLGWPVEDRIVYILGAGGSARAIAFALAGAGSRVVVANRSPERAATLVDAVNAVYAGSAVTAAWGSAEAPAGVELVVNTTSLGMHPREDECPEVPANLIRPDVRYYDLIYAPEETVFLRRAREARCEASNGLDMLVQQGAISLSIWSGIPIDDLPVDVMERSVRASA
jgi:shikimate dehydrogenase